MTEAPPAPTLPSAAGGIEIITFGCRLNAYESRVIRGAAAAAGLADAVIVNTCAVTNLAERQARHASQPGRPRALHLLHHPLWPRQQPLGTDRRDRPAGARPRRGGVSRDRPQRRRPHGVRRRSAGPAEPRRDGAPAAGAGARARAAAPLLARPGRDRRRIVAPAGRGDAADAASPSLAAGRRRPHPEAHEAAPQPRRS